MTNSRTPDTAKGNVAQLENKFGYAAHTEEPQKPADTAPAKGFLAGILERSKAEHDQMQAYCEKNGVTFPTYKPPEL